MEEFSIEEFQEMGYGRFIHFLITEMKQVMVCCFLLNSLPNDKTVDLLKLKAFADDKLNLTQKLKFALGRVENIVGKGENAGHQQFLLFLQCFQKALSGSLKVRIVW